MIVLRNKIFAKILLTSSGKKAEEAIKAMDNLRRHWGDTHYLERTVSDIYHGARVYRKVRVPYTLPPV